ncbi:MAG TPA: transporter substrate-binding domain-containing protein, partial [Lachnospiraceae bacterium]|nr:transporter substrate-binding domain-containing protein [Lachnospiraceae bacterium]
MKKLLALFLSAVCVMGTLSACGEVTTATDEPAASGNEAGTSDASASTDVVDDYGTIVANGKMVIGITEYEPMNYYDESGTLIGFDTEFAQAICAKLGITAEFQVIDWDMKETELKSGNIDCIWNGLTVTEDRRENMDFSTS